jgi:Tol biopolymer transport system component
MKIIHSSGGEERVLTQLDLNKEELMHSYPYYIQGEEKVLYARESISDFLSINVLDLKTGKDKELVKGASKPYYLEDGYLTYSYEGSLFACPYDPDKNVLINEPLVIIDNTREESGQYYIQYAVSEDGTLVYMDYEAALGGELVEVDPEGTITPIDIDDEEMLWVAGPKYSPDGRHLAYWKAMEGGTHVWIYDFSRGQHSRFTSTGTNAWPIWTPDGSRIAFPSIRGSSPDLNMYIKSFVSNTPSEAILKSNITQQPKAWSNNEKLLLYHQQEESDKGWGVYMLNMETGESSPFLNGDYDERIPDFSPDDKWVVYESNETGIFEIFVTDFPEREMKYQISLDGGNEPMWSHKGNRIIYRKANGFYEVQVNMENEDISFVRPKLLFSGSYLYIGGWGRNYDLSPDESRIVTVRQSNINDTRSSLQVITNFPDKIRTEIGGD